jgi:capsular polysaccharide biosynthesis protein
MRNQQDTIDLRGLLLVIRRRWIAMLGTTVIAVAIAAAITFWQQPQYEARVTMLAGQGKGIADVQVIPAINQATQSLARMAIDRVVVEQALKDLDLPGKVQAGDIAARTSSSVPPNTQQIVLTVRDSDPKRAALLANGIAGTFSRMVTQRVSDKSQLTATVWQPAIEPTSPTSPNIPLNIALGLVLGMLAGIALAFVREQLDTTWRSELDVESALGVPVLGVIPEITTRNAYEQVYA